MKRNPYVDFLAKYLGDGSEAYLWLLAYGLYVHAIDDIVDGDKTDMQHLLKTFEFAATVYAYPFFMENATRLYPLVKMASSTYMNSVLMEKEKKPWMVNYGDFLRQCGNEVVLAVIEIACGLDTRIKASMELRELSYTLHHNELGQPV